MRIDASRDALALAHGYSRVILQQGRPFFDSDWNEHTAIVLGQMRLLAAATYGQHGGPGGTRCGFIPFWRHAHLWVTGGVYTVDGFAVSCDEQPVVAGRNTKIDGLPMLPKSAGPHLVYLEVVETAETTATNPGLGEPALPGVDLAARGKLKWRVRLLHLEPPGHWKDPVQKWLSGFDAERGETLSKPGAAAADYLQTAAAKANNQLLRLELHDRSDAETAIWKLSRDNAFRLFRIVPQQSGAAAQSAVTIDPGALADWMPEIGSPVELLTRERAEFDEPGELAKITAIDARPDGSFDVSLGGAAASWVLPDKAEFLRVWDELVPLPAGEAEPGDYCLLEVRDGMPAIGGSHGMPAIGGSRFHKARRRKAPLAILDIPADGRTPTIVRRLQRVINVPWREVDDEYERVPSPDTSDPVEPEGGADGFSTR